MLRNSKINRYIYWMAFNSAVNSCSSVISTNSMLGSIMVSPSYTDVLAVTYIGKDIIGQIGGLLYSLKTGKNADKHPKKYINKGVFTQQFSYHLENLSVFINNSNYVLPFLGFTSMLKNISFITVGAVNARNLQHFSGENIGELYSKVASINTIFSTIGMMTGLGLIHFIPSYSCRSIVILPVLSVLSLYSVKRAMKIVEEMEEME